MLALSHSCSQHTLHLLIAAVACRRCTCGGCSCCSQLGARLLGNARRFDAGRQLHANEPSLEDRHWSPIRAPLSQSWNARVLHYINSSLVFAGTRPVGQKPGRYLRASVQRVPFDKVKVCWRRAARRLATPATRIVDAHVSPLLLAAVWRLASVRAKSTRTC